MFTKLMGYLDANIGRCSDCMKTAFVCAVLAWLVWAGVAMLFGAGLPGFLILGPVALTLLWGAHFVTYSGRILAALWREYVLTGHVDGGVAGAMGANIDRRRIVWALGTAVGIGILGSVWLPARAVAAGHACGTGHCPDDAPNCCRSVTKCCNGIWACVKHGSCHSSHSSARRKCGKDGLVIACV